MTAASLGLQMKDLANSARTESYEREQQFCARCIATWEERRKKLGERTIAILPELIKARAQDGKDSILLQVQISPPGMYSDEITSFRSDYGKDLKLRKGNLSEHDCRNLPHGSRQIARWAIRQGLKVITAEWREDDDRFKRLYYGLYEVDAYEDYVLPRSYQHTRLEGLTLAWW